MTDDEPIALRSSSVAQEDPPPPPDPDGFDFDAFEASIIDRSAHHSPFYVANGTQIPYTPAIRPVAAVTGICLHQTACEMGERPERYDRLSIQFVVTRSGKVIRTCDPLSLLYGGNGWNAGTIQIECDGLYAGLEDDPSTVLVNEAMRTTWDDPSTPFREQPQQVTPEAMRRLRNLCRYIIEWVKRKGGGIRVIVAHRQSSGNRESDPGQAIWQEGAEPIIAEYGLNSGGVGFALQDGAGGKPLPDAWTGQANGIKY